jgi:Arc/MetJ-type ribon-helix-helix transcriptional regulator
MEVQLTPDQEAFIRQAVAGGPYPSAEATVRDAMARREERGRARVELLATLDAAQADTGRKPSRAAAAILRRCYALRIFARVFGGKKHGHARQSP